MSQVNWRQVFDQANQFDRAAQLLIEQSVRWFAAPTPGDAPLVVPCVVCNALAAELYLKCILFIETGGVPRGHSLKTLFGRMSRDSREAVTTRYDSLVAGNPVIPLMEQQVPGTSHVLSDVLRSSDHVFEQFRYIYERPSGSPHGLPELVAALRGRASLLGEAA